MKKLVVLGAGALAATSIGLLSAGLASSQPANPNGMNVIGEPYYKAVKILKGMGLSTGFGGSVGSALPQAQCMVSSQKMTEQRQDAAEPRLQRRSRTADGRERCLVRAVPPVRPARYVEAATDPDRPGAPAPAPPRHG